MISQRAAATIPRPLPALSPRAATRWLVALGLAAAGGAAIAHNTMWALLALGLVPVLVAVRRVDTLAIVMLWTLPYMSVNLPTGGFTLKLSDAPADLFAVAWLVRTLWRRDKIAFPPASAQVLVYLAALAISSAFSPPVPIPFRGGLEFPNRNAPELRSLSLIIWLGLSWVLVTGLYNVAGDRPAFYRRCIRTHIMASGVACAISLVMYVLGLRGYTFTEAGGRSLVFDSGTYFRLAGVAYEPLFLGFYLITVIPVTISVLLTRPTWMPVWLLRTVLLLQAAAMFLTFSSGGWAGLGVVLLLLSPLFFRYIKPASWIRLAIGTGIAVVLLAGTLATHPKWTTIGPTMVQKIFAGGDQMRQREWEVGYALIRDYPVLGIGPGMARFYFARYHYFVRSAPDAPDFEINNAYINVFAESGIVGLFAFIWCGLAGAGALAIVIKRYGIHRVPILTALTASLVGCATQYASLNALFLVYFPMLIGLAAAGARLAHTYAERANETGLVRQ